MQDCERGSATDRDWERASVEGSNVSAKLRSRQRRSVEVKAWIVRESFWPGTRVEDSARRYGLTRKQLSAWRSLARQGKLAVPSSAETVVVAPQPQPAFATLEVDNATDPGSMGPGSGICRSAQAGFVTGPCNGVSSECECIRKSTWARFVPGGDRLMEGDSHFASTHGRREQRSSTWRIMAAMHRRVP